MFIVHMPVAVWLNVVSWIFARMEMWRQMNESGHKLYPNFCQQQLRICDPSNQIQSSTRHSINQRLSLINENCNIQLYISIISQTEVRMHLQRLKFPFKTMQANNQNGQPTLVESHKTIHWFIPSSNCMMYVSIVPRLNRLAMTTNDSISIIKVLLPLVQSGRLDTAVHECLLHVEVALKLQMEERRLSQERGEAPSSGRHRSEQLRDVSQGVAAVLLILTAIMVLTLIHQPHRIRRKYSGAACSNAQARRSAQLISGIVTASMSTDEQSRGTGAQSAVHSVCPICLENLRTFTAASYLQDVRTDEKQTLVETTQDTSRFFMVSIDAASQEQQPSCSPDTESNSCFVDCESDAVRSLENRVPATLACGHSLCRGCLANYLFAGIARQHKEDPLPLCWCCCTVALRCPLCRAVMRRTLQLWHCGHNHLLDCAVGSRNEEVFAEGDVAVMAADRTGSDLSDPSASTSASSGSSSSVAEQCSGFSVQVLWAEDSTARDSGDPYFDLFEHRAI